MENKGNILTIIRGAPGQGKTTFAKKNFNCLILENDMFHEKGGKYRYDGKIQGNAIDWCIDVTDMTLRNGSDVCVANTFTKRKYIDCYKRLAELYGAEFKIYRMMGNFNNVHGLTKSMVSRFSDNMEDYEGEILVFPNCDGSYTMSEKV